MFKFGHKSKDKDQKDKEKDDKKKEKKEKKEKEKKDKQRVPMTQEEIKRLDEVKKGVFRHFSVRDKSKKSGHKSHDEGVHVDRDSSDSSISSGGHKSPSVEELAKPQAVRPIPEPRKFTPIPEPKPKSILKAKMSNPQSISTVMDPLSLQENTVSNCLNAHIVGEHNGDVKHSVNGDSSPQLPTSPTSPKSPETVHEKSFKTKLRLPAIVPPKPPRIRELDLHRQPTGGFGFSLRKGIITEKGGGDTEETKHFVIFAEPGSGPKAPQTGLIPGDRLVEVNDVNVQTMTREEVVEIIKKSGETLRICVQPIPELIELSVRPALDGSKIEIQDDVVKGGTLKRNASLRYKKGVSTKCIIIDFHKIISLLQYFQ